MSQQSASLSNWLGYLTRQMGPGVGFFAASGCGFAMSVMVAKSCTPQLVVSDSLVYQFSRSQGVASNVDSAVRDTSWRKIMSTGGTAFWRCEIIDEIRVAESGAPASTFQVARTSFGSSAGVVSVLVLF